MADATESEDVVDDVAEAAEAGAVDEAEPTEGGEAKVEKPSLKDRLAELGTMGLVVYLVIFVLTVAGFAIAISMGFEIESAGGGTGVLFAAWVATKFTQPLRIGATFVVTPFVVALWHKFRPPAVPKADDESPDSDAADAESDDDSDDDS